MTSASRCPFVIQVWILNVALDLTFGIGNGDDSPNKTAYQDFSVILVSPFHWQPKSDWQ